jgi:hypothetical protein
VAITCYTQFGRELASRILIGDYDAILRK